MSAGLWVIYTGPKSWCKLVTLFDSYSDDGVIAAIGAQHTSLKSGCELVTLSDSQGNPFLKWVVKHPTVKMRH